MSFWSTLAPVAPIAGMALGGPIGGMAAGAVTGGLAAREKRNEELARQQRTANAAADAIGVSWGRRDGHGSIPDVQYAQGTDAGNMAAGVTGGLMSGYQASKDYGNLFGGPSGPSMSADLKAKPGMLGSKGFDWGAAKQAQNLYTPNLSMNSKYL